MATEAETQRKAAEEGKEVASLKLLGLIQQKFVEVCG